MPGNSIYTYRGPKARFSEKLQRYQMDRGIERIRKLPYCIFRVKKKAGGFRPPAAASNARSLLCHPEHHVHALQVLQDVVVRYCRAGALCRTAGDQGQVLVNSADDSICVYL